MRRVRRSRSIASVPEPTFTEEEYRLARHKGTFLVQREVKIKCGQNFHKIQMRFPGHVTLLNHDRKEERMIAKLGGSDYRKPECLDFLESWTQGQNSGYRPLVLEIEKCRAKARGIKTAERMRYSDWLEMPIYERLMKRLGQVYENVLEKLKARFSTERARYNYYRTSVDSIPEELGQVLIPKMRLEFLDTRKQAIDIKVEALNYGQDPGVRELRD